MRADDLLGAGPVPEGLSVADEDLIGQRTRMAAVAAEYDDARLARVTEHVDNNVGQLQARLLKLQRWQRVLAQEGHERAIRAMPDA